MADFLLLFGERGAIARHGLWKRFPASVIISPNVPTYSLHVGFRPGPRPYPGEFGCTRKLAIAWVGAWRNLPEMRRQFGLSYTTGALETMAHAYHKLGPTAAFSAMRGIVTAVVWDMQTGTLHAFRDKIGLAPLVYAPTPKNLSQHNLALSTDPEWLADWMDTPTDVNPARLRAFLSGSVDSGIEDFIHGMERIRPGEHVHWTPERTEPSRSYYWQPDTTPLPAEQAASNLPQRLIDGLNRFYDSLVPRPRVVAMSGGLDSPALAAIESRWGGYSPERPLHVVSMITPGLPRSDETHAINEVKAYLPLHVHLFDVESKWPLQNISFYNRQLYSGPHFHPEEFYVDAYHRWIAEQFGPVDVLSGHGTDDALWCPASFYLRDLAKKLHVREFIQAMRQAGPGLVAREMINWTLESLHLREPLRQLFAPLRQAIQPASPTPWRAPENWVSFPEPCATTNTAGWSTPDENWGQVRLKRLRTWKWELVCRTLQREARRNNVNIEFPMLDDAMWELCLRIEPQQLANNGRQKALLRKAMHGRLPTSVVQRSKHGGFDALVELALTQKEVGRVEELFQNSILHNMEVINAQNFMNMFQQYRKASLHNQRPYLGSLALWQTIAAEVWLNSLHQRSSLQ